MRSFIYQYLAGNMTRRRFVSALGGIGVSSTVAGRFAESLAQAAQEEPPAASKKLKDLSGGQITAEFLKLWGVEYVFGNTGGHEVGFLDALVDYPEIKYILGLHEGSVMAMADGYARVTGSPAFVNVHAITGTGNILGMMVNAWADNSPVVITVGMSDSRGENLGVFTETPKLESIPAPYSKLSFRVSRPENLAESTRRAFQVASTPPSGPVFLAVPMDVWIDKAAAAELIPPQRSTVHSRLMPDAEAIRTAADWLARSRTPLLVSGAELARFGGLKELVEVSDWLGAPVSGDTSSSRSSMGFPTHHPRYLGPLAGPIDSPEPFDLVLLAGTSRLTLMGARPQPLIPREARVIEIGIREDHLARGYPADLLIFAHPEDSLRALLSELQRRTVDAPKQEHLSRFGAALKEKRSSTLKSLLNSEWNATPISPARLAADINKAIQQDAILVTETVSSDSSIWNFVDFDQPGGGRRHIVSSGGSLGWGLGAACGVKLGAPKKQVALAVGDGSYQFGVQALWTARRFEMPIIIVIFNNRNYQANRFGVAQLRGRAAQTGKYIGVNLVDPEIDHVGIARSYGIDGEKVTHPDQIAPALERAVAAERSGRAYVLDVVIARQGTGADSNWYEKFSVARM